MGFGDKIKKEKDAEKKAATGKQQAAAKEDAAWEDNDKGNKAKAARKNEKEAKDADKAAKKEELKALEAAENESNSKLVKAKAPAKLTQQQIARNKAMAAALAGGAGKTDPKKKGTIDQPELKPNMNHVLQDERLQADQAGVEVVEGHGLYEVMGALGISDGPKKKKTFKEFEHEIMATLKEENPGLKMSQYNELAFKQWKKSPENPANQN